MKHADFEWSKIFNRGQKRERALEAKNVIQGDLFYKMFIIVR